MSPIVRLILGALGAVTMAAGGFALASEDPRGWVAIVVGTACFLLVERPHPAAISISTRTPSPGRRRLTAATHGAAAGPSPGHSWWIASMPATSLTAAMVLAAVLTAIDVAAPDMPLRELDYDALMSHDPRERGEIAASLTAENRVALITDHLRRWLAKNQDRLTPEQQSLISEWLEFLTPDVFSADAGEQVHHAWDDLNNRSDAAFDADDIRDALTFEGPYIPETVAPI